MRPPERADLSTNVGPDECTLAVGAVAIRLSDHAVIRYRQRVRPGLERRQAHRDLERLLRYGFISSHAPLWLQTTQAQRSAYYLIVGDVVLPLDPCARDRRRLVALTCLTRGGLSNVARASRNLKRRRRPGPPV